MKNVAVTALASHHNNEITYKGMDRKMINTEKERFTFGIVENDIISSNAVIHFIDVMFSNASVIWSKTDGISALKAVRQEPPDILILDIKIPGMDGLQLCEHLCQENYNGVILIKTAYNEFSYVRKAIQLNIFDYIVKPVDNEELFDAIDRCIVEAKRRNALNEDMDEIITIVQNIGQSAFEIMGRDTEIEGRIIQLFKVMGWPSDGKYSAFVMHFFSESCFSDEEINIILGYKKLFTAERFLGTYNHTADNHIIVVLQPRLDVPSAKWHSLVWCFALMVTQSIKNATARISRLCGDISTIIEEYSLADPVKNKVSEFSGDRVIMPFYSLRVIPKKDTEKYKNSYERYFRDGVAKRAQKSVSCILDLYAYDLAEAFWEMVQIIICAASRAWREENFKAVITTLFLPDIDYMQWINGFFRFCTYLPDPQAGDSIDSIVEFMKKSYSHNITQAVVAEKMGLDPAYFSRLFKRRTGRKFSEMLTELRMKHAEEMLRGNPNCTLEELCEGCGLSSTTYFSEVFKKWKGVTVTQFLKNRAD